MDSTADLENIPPSGGVMTELLGGCSPKSGGVLTPPRGGLDKTLVSEMSLGLIPANRALKILIYLLTYSSFHQPINVNVTLIILYPAT